MEYSDLVTAIRKNDHKRINAIFGKLTPVLVNYLRANLGCHLADAQDCAQQAIVNTLDKIRNNKIREPDNIYSYLLKSCRNNFLRLKKQQSKLVSEDNLKYLTNPSDQLKEILEEERIRILEECIRQLSVLHKKFIRYLFENPEADTRKVANHFNLSLGGAWSKKHRIIQKLSDCVKEKMKF